MVRKYLSVLAILATASSPVFAITAGGELDGDGHPHVGLMIAKDGAGNPLWRCSGTLLSPTVFLTAGHCTESPAVTAELWFDPDMQSPGKGYPMTGEANGTVHTHPQYNPNAFYLYDLGVVVLNTPVVKSQYGALPALNELDAMATQRGKQNQTFTAVGYGLQQINPVFVSQLKIPHGRHAATHPDQHRLHRSAVDPAVEQPLDRRHLLRRFGRPELHRILERRGRRDLVRHQRHCAGTGGVYRVDQEDDLTWVRGFLGL